jgi:hypothetical protein
VAFLEEIGKVYLSYFGKWHQPYPFERMNIGRIIK